MRILVNHLTRMQRGAICVAGIEEQSGLHIRPVGHRQLTTELLACHGGPLRMAAVIDLGETNFAGSMPEIEDRLGDPRQWTRVGQLTRREMAEQVRPLARDDLTEIFGPDLRPHGGRTFVVPAHQGLRSLGCFWARQAQLVFVGSSQRLRFTCRHDDFSLRLPITDIHLYRQDHVTPHRDVVARLNTQFQRSDRVLLSVGLSRAYRKSNDEPAYHWLQVNNLIDPFAPDLRS